MILGEHLKLIREIAEEMEMNVVGDQGDRVKNPNCLGMAADCDSEKVTWDRNSRTRAEDLANQTVLIDKVAMMKFEPVISFVYTWKSVTSQDVSHAIGMLVAIRVHHACRANLLCIEEYWIGIGA
ncbi:hypothetical protein AWZ03_010948 [Drosophila navojoa]|uniref:Uncharacterized protein n=1 Tax=Drosophila navojoa TaxID=7232 RepID=A0A484B3I0_DRONA|nr:hypothetical protein AWZ03_010948 [Drosophila navojoa]